MFLLSLDPLNLLAWIIGFITALTIHEFAHAYTADHLGDPTARYAGRISLNPLNHLDPAGTLFLVFAGFGWGKPVPVNPRNFADPRVGQILTSAAGPLANLALALILAIPYNFLLTPNTETWIFIQTVIYLNIVILVFNLLPIYPLDGGNIIAPLLSPKVAQYFFQYGPVVLFSVIALDWVFHASILWNLLVPLIEIVWAGVNLATRFGIP